MIIFNYITKRSDKSHLTLTIANELINNGIEVVYMSYRESITTIKQSIVDSINYSKAINKYKNANILLIDDFYKGSITQSDINLLH